jgi:serine/threonine protein phosphatase 1
MTSPAAGWIYAVGDIHGRFDLLSRAVFAIARHAGERPRRMIFLGDYVDRGPASRPVVDRLMALEEAGEATCIKGNHEEMMVRALSEGGQSWWHWLANGGAETLASYGAASREEAAETVPARHLAWMSGLPLTTADEHRIYVHAGLDPRPGQIFAEESCLWIRERFLRAPASALPAHVVHGHTPYWAGKPDPAQPERLGHRTNLDTGAFATGILSVGVFDPDQSGGPVEILRIEGDPEPGRERAEADLRTPQVRTGGARRAR